MTTLQGPRPCGVDFLPCTSALRCIASSGKTNEIVFVGKPQLLRGERAAHPSSCAAAARWWCRAGSGAASGQNALAAAGRSLETTGRWIGARPFLFAFPFYFPCLAATGVSTGGFQSLPGIEAINRRV